MQRNVSVLLVGVGLAFGFGGLTACYSAVGEPNADGTLGAPATDGTRVKSSSANGMIPDPGVAADQGGGSEGDDAGSVVDVPDAGSPDLDAGPAPAPDDAGPPADDDAGPPVDDAGPPAVDAGSPQGGCGTGRGAPYFNAPVATNAGGWGFALVIADLNGDGLSDLVTGENSQVEVSLALDGGGFADPVGYDCGSGPVAVVAADFDGDGHLDLALANNYDNTVSVLLGAGDGTFGTATNITVSEFPYELAAQDLNGDGKIDLLVAGADSLDLLVNQGAGSFAAPVSLASGNYNWGLATSDVNQDGVPDIEVSNRGNQSIDIFIADGDGGFAAAVSYASQPEPDGIVVADFNGDGQVDLAVGNWGDGTNGSLSLWLGQGGGLFGTRADYPAVAGGVHGVVAADFNGDCLLDVAVAGYDSNINDCANANGGVALLLNDGLGGFGAPIAIASGGISPLEVATIVLPGTSSPAMAVTQNVCGWGSTVEILSSTGP